jgi:zinc transport system permease protein
MEILGYPFVQNALLAGILAALASGIIGSLVVVNRMVFLAGGIAHAAYGGVGLAFYMGWPVLPSVLGFSLANSVIMGILTRRRFERTDTIIGVIWALGMALGIVLIDLTPGYNVDLMSFLFGSILAVSTQDLMLMGILDLILIASVLLLYRLLLAQSYDREFLAARGVNTTALHLFLMALMAASVVMTIRITGLVLVMALFTMAPYMAEKWTGSLMSMMIVAAALNTLFVTAGIGLACMFNLTSGATIILVAACFFLLTRLPFPVKRLKGGIAPFPKGTKAE